MGIASEAHPSHVVDPVPLQVLKRGWEPMPDDSDGMVRQLLVDRCGVREEKQIRVHVCDSALRGRAGIWSQSPADPLHPEGRASDMPAASAPVLDSESEYRRRWP